MKMKTWIRLKNNITFPWNLIWSILTCCLNKTLSDYLYLNMITIYLENKYKRLSSYINFVIKNILYVSNMYVENYFIYLTIYNSFFHTIAFIIQKYVCNDHKIK